MRRLGGYRVRRQVVGSITIAALVCVPLVATAQTGETPPRPVAAPAPAAPSWGPIEIGQARARPGERVRSGIATSQSFAGIEVETPFVIARGATPGPTLCLTAGVHGDELAGIEIVRRVLVDSEPVELAGTLIGVPIANPHGFRRSSRYLPDRRDLNRFFPGREAGSAASRIARTLFEGLITHCDALVDFHTGSFHRTNMPHLRADLRLPRVAILARRFGSSVVVNNAGAPGTLRRAATDRGIPSITYEAGEAMRLNEPDIAAGVAGTLRLLQEMRMRESEREREVPDQEVYESTRWVRVDAGGILRSHVQLGDRVVSGTRLGSVIDPGTNRRTAIHSPYPGRIIGMALDQVVIPGFAAFHLGIPGSALAPDLEGSDDVEGLEEGGDPEEQPE